MSTYGPPKTHAEEMFNRFKSNGERAFPDFPKIYITDVCPPDRIYLIQAKYLPEGGFDMRATALASSIIENISKE